MCSACSRVWRLSYVVDNCNVVATEHSRYGLSCTYVETTLQEEECCCDQGFVFLNECLNVQRWSSCIP